MQIPTAPSVPRWKGSAQNEDMLDPFVTLHSPKLETTKAPEPFRAAASETQLDVEPEFGETKLHSPQDHMAAWNLRRKHQRKNLRVHPVQKQNRMRRKRQNRKLYWPSRSR